jgi:hypothetical protein
MGCRTAAITDQRFGDPGVSSGAAFFAGLSDPATFCAKSLIYVIENTIFAGDRPRVVIYALVILRSHRSSSLNYASTSYIS